MTTALFKAAAVLFATTLVTAQVQCAPTSSAGTLGQRYVEGRIGRTKPDDEVVFDRKSAGAIALNLPLTSAFDLSFGGTLGKTRGSTIPGMLASSVDYTRRERAAYVRATGYLRNEAVAPFVRVSGSFESATEVRVWGPRATIPGGRIEVRDQSTGWSAGGGAEILLGRVALTPAIEYFDFNRDLYTADVQQGWLLGLEAHLWLTKSIGGLAHVQYAHTDRDYTYRAWSWYAGARLRF